MAHKANGEMVLSLMIHILLFCNDGLHLPKADQEQILFKMTFNVYAIINQVMIYMHSNYPTTLRI